MAEPGAQHCVNHPERETLVRCSKCDAPICLKCRVETPVGFRCRECGIYRPVQYQVPPVLFAPALGVGLIAGFIGGMIGPLLGFYAIFLGPVFGTAVGESITRVTRGKRGRALATLAATCLVLGALLAPVVAHRSVSVVVDQFLNPGFWCYVVFAAPAAWWRLR